MHSYRQPSATKPAGKSDVDPIHARSRGAVSSRLDGVGIAPPARQHPSTDGTATPRRTLRLTEGIAEIAVRQTGPPEAPRLVVSVASERPGRYVRAEVTSLLQRVLGLDVDLRDFYRRAESDPLLGQLVNRFRGLKPPRFPSIFECLANAVACQQLTLTVGINLLNRLAEALGPVSRGSAAHGCARVSSRRPSY